MRSGGWIVLLALFLGVLSWLVEGVADYYALRGGEGDLGDSLIFVPARELLAHCAVLLIFIMFGVVMAVAYNRRRQAEESLRESEQRYRTVADFTYDWEYWQAADGAFVYVSPSCERITGYTPQDFINNPKLLVDITHPDDREKFANHFFTSSCTDVPDEKDEMDIRIINRNGQQRWISHSCQRVYDSNGNFAGRRANNRDITERKLAEQALRESEARLHSIVDSAPYGAHVYELKPDGRLIFTGANHSADEILGVRNDRFIGMTIEEAFPALTQTPIPDAYRRVAATGEPFETEHLTYNESGIAGAFDLHACQIGPNQMAVFFRDITERTKAEQAMIIRQAKLDSLFKAAPTGIGIVVDRRFVEVNERVCIMTGYSRNELIGQNSRMIYPTQEEYDKVGSIKYSEIAKTGMGTVETRMQHKDGTIFDVLLSSAPIDPEDLSQGVTFTMLDITERKQAEEALRLMQFSIDHATDAAFWIDSEARITYVNEEACRSLGYSRDELTGMTVFDIDPVFSREQWDSTWQDMERIGSAHLETYHKTKQGEIFPVEISTSFLEFAGKKYDFAFARNITKRKQAEEALRAKTEELDLFFSIVLDMLCIADTDGNFHLVNPAWEQTLGYSKVELEGRRFLDFVHPDDLSATMESIADLESGKLIIDFTNRYLCRDGSYKWLEWRSAPYQKRLIIAAARDITQRKHAEEEKREFYRETIRSVTEGKLDLVSLEDIKPYLDSAEMSITVSSPADIMDARHHATTYCTQQGLDGDRLQLFELAVGEAITNAVKHAHGGNIYAGISDGSMWTAVSDDGPGISTLTLPGATLRKGYSTKASMGMGYSIMMEASDRILLCTGPHGTIVVLFINIAPADLSVSLDELKDTWNDIPMPDYQLPMQHS